MNNIQLKNKYIIYLYGPPGAGKGEICKILKNIINCFIIPSSQILYQYLNQNNAIQEINNINKGIILNHDNVFMKNFSNIINNKILNYIKFTNYDFIIIDGYPREPLQSQHNSLFLKKIINFNIKIMFLHINTKYSICIDRINKRVSCIQCRQSFININYCYNCKLPLQQRKDDNSQIYLQRYKQYIDITEKSINNLKNIFDHQYFQINNNYTTIELNDQLNKIFDFINKNKFL